MSFKTVLTVTGPGFGNGDLNLAAALCEEIQAHLAVFVVGIAAPPPIGEYAAIVSDDWLRERHADQTKLRKRVSSVLSLLASNPIPSDVSEGYSELVATDDVIGRRARYADITILGPEMLAGGILKEKIIEGALFSSGKPLLLVPKDSTPTLKPKCIMIAWDSGIEASNAVNCSLDLLAAAEDVHLVLIDPINGENGQGEEPGADAATYLARHGVKVTVDRLPSQGRSIATALHQHSIDIAANLMVMGAYGHSRLRERIFGGVTRSMIEKPPLPVLMAR